MTKKTDPRMVATMTMSEWVRPRQRSTRPRSAYQEFMGKCLIENRDKLKGPREQRTEVFKGCVQQWRDKKAAAKK